MIGTLVGHYRITAKLGEGGMGAVYRATDTKLNRDVAVKVIPESFAADSERLGRFTREAQVLASLNHPNIAAIYGVEDRALIMELVEGAPLSGPVPLQLALQYARQIAEALEAAHEKGIVHRDLKPANIMVTGDGVIKVLDFGLAKSAEPAAGSNQSNSPTLTLPATEVGLILGTAAYMSPEQASGKVVDKRADIWAFGVVLYELLTGKALFASETVSHTLAHVLTRPIDLTAAPATVRPLLARCLDRDPKTRLRDIGEARLAIGTLLSGGTPDPAGDSPPRRPWLPWAVAAAALLSATATWLLRPVAATASLPYRFTLDGPRTFPTISPDGRWFLWRSADGLRLRAHNSTAWRPLPRTEQADLPFFASDSSAIGFFAEGRLRVIAIDGTEIRDLAAATNPAGGAWRGNLREGLIIFAAGPELRRVDLATGKEDSIPVPMRPGKCPRFPVFVPDGNRILYVGAQCLGSGVEGDATFAVDLDAPSQEPEKIVDSYRQIRPVRDPHTGKWDLLFTKGSLDVDGLTLFAAPIDPARGSFTGAPIKLLSNMGQLTGTGLSTFDAAPNGVIAWSDTRKPVYHLRWFDREGNVLSTFGDADAFVGLTLSPDESRIAVMIGPSRRDIWIYDARTGARNRLSTEAGSKEFPVWSPDNRYVYYVLRSEAGQALGRRLADGSGKFESLYSTPPGSRLSLQQITPDGKYLLGRQSGVGEKSGIIRLATDVPGAQPELILQDTSDSGVARVTPDGRWLIQFDFGSEARIYPYPVIGPNPVKALPVTHTSPVFSADGRLLYSQVPDSGSPWYSLVAHRVEPDATAFRLGARTILFSTSQIGRAGATNFAVTRDGSRILAINTDAVDELRAQVLTDWTQLIEEQAK